MEGQMVFEDWMPEACPGTKEYEAAKIKEAKQDETASLPGGRRKTIAENEDAVVKEPEGNYTAENRENWYALLVAIVRKDINSADDALAAMGIKRTYNSSMQDVEDDYDPYWEDPDWDDDFWEKECPY